MMGGYGGGMMGGMMGGGMGGGNTSGELVNLIEQIIEPDSWYDTSDEGEGTIYPYPQMSPKKLAVTNTPEVHAQIEKLLESLRQSLGHQVSIEARILQVGENWLNDVGLDVDFTMNAGGKFGMLEFQQGSILTAAPEPTKIQGNLAQSPASMGVAGGYGSILDDLQVAFLIKATQARTDAKSLIAPRATVLDGETANFSNYNTVTWVPPPRSTTTVTPTGIGTAATSTDYSASVQSIQVGVPLYITPTISYDKKYVMLNINFSFSDVLRIRTHTVDYIGSDGTVQTLQQSVPETSTTQLTTRVSIPDGGTLLLGGQRVSQETNKEAGVPVLSKIPILNRFFMNRSNVRDQQIMLILVRPTIMLQEESEAEALGEMESLY
jgi:type II secretory pathway component GspD/PulD (secretin)